MYQQFYQLKENAFRLNPDPGFLCMMHQHREALAGLVYSVCTRPGLSVLVGEAGTGKTTLLYALLNILAKRRFVTAMCNNPTLTRAEFYDSLVSKFGIEVSSGLKSRQLLALQEAFLRNRTDGRPSLLIVDEAQRLSPELLEEIRLLLNMETPREKLLEIIIAGQPELLDVLRRPEMKQLKQRVSTLCKLHPLTVEELKEYIKFRLTQAGLPEQRLFPESTIELIYHYTQGIPRLVNSLCDGALRSGFALQSTRITPSIVDEAAKDLDLSILRSQTGMDEFDADAGLIASSAEESQAAPLPAIVGDGRRNGHREAGPVLAEKTFEQRQRSLGFFANLIDRWK